MDYTEGMALLKSSKQIRDALSVSIKIDCGQVEEITVGDLIGKYKVCRERKDIKYVDAFAIVLRFYLTEEEFEKYTA